MKPNVVKLKIDASHLSAKKKQRLIDMFCQGKWCYNHFLEEINSGKKYKDIDAQPRTVAVKCGEDYESREVAALGSLMKSGIFNRIKSQVKGLATKKAKGERVGALSFKSRMDSIPLRRCGEGYSFKEKTAHPYNYVRFTNNDSWYRVRGGGQFAALFEKYGEDACEFADGKLIDAGNGDFYVHVTVFTPWPDREATGRVCALDFGVGGDAQVTTSDGEVCAWEFLESDALKDAQRRNQAFREWSEKVEGSARSSRAQKRVISREYARLGNVKDDVAAKFVHDLLDAYDFIVIQDEQLAAWKQEQAWSKGIHHSILGRVLSRLRRHPRTVVIDRWAPTTKVCSCCGHVLGASLDMRVREWECPVCGARHHRDVNACEVMLLEASDVLEGYRLACGDGSGSGRGAVGVSGGSACRVSRVDALAALAGWVGCRSVI